jgi:broad specificity phosphatase PhoE
VRLALTRHGQTDWNAQGRFQGSSDVPLNDTGRGQATEAALRFDGSEWHAVVSSPLSRAEETARILAAELGIGFRGTYPDLAERDYGEAEGVRESDARERWAADAFPGLEPREAVAARGLRALDRLAADLPGQRVIVVAHGTLIREILRRLASADIPPILNAATSLIEREGTDRGWRVLTVNDHELSAV